MPIAAQLGERRHIGNRLGEKARRIDGGLERVKRHKRLLRERLAVLRHSASWALNAAITLLRMPDIEPERSTTNAM